MSFAPSSIVSVFLNPDLLYLKFRCSLRTTCSPRFLVLINSHKNIRSPSFLPSITHLHHHYHYLLLLLLHDVNDTTRIDEPEGSDKTNKNRRLNNNVWHVVRELSKLSASCLPRLHFSRVFPVVNGIEKRRKLRRNDRSLVTAKKGKRKGNSRRPDCQMHVQQRRDLSPGKRKLRRRYSYNISTRRLFIFRLQIERRDVGFERR